MKKQNSVFTFGCMLFLGSVIISLFLVVVFLRFAFKTDSLSKDEIFDVVNNKYDIIIKNIQEDKTSSLEIIRGVKNVEDHDGVIEFYCGGKGNVASGVYCGFYYTADDLPKVSFMSYLLISEEDLIPKGKGYCFDKYDYYYTEKIRDNFYYYEAHY